MVPPHTAVDTGHGRRARRTIKVATAPAWLTFAGAAQVAQVRRTTTRNGARSVDIVYVITTADHQALRPATLAAWVRDPLGHREPAALGQRCDLRGGPLPDPNRPHPTSHGYHP